MSRTMVSVAMRREAVYRIWTTLVAIAACASGLVLWQHGERVMGGLGLATSLLHLVWRIDLRRCTRACVQRRPIVIPQLHPMVVSPPKQALAQRLHAWWRGHG
jgi:hypothetical protein